MLTIVRKEDRENLFDTYSISETSREDNVLDFTDLDLTNSLGEWKDNFLNVVYHLLKEENEYSLVLEFDDHSYHKKAVTFEILDKIYKFRVKESLSGEYYLLNGEYLEEWDEIGPIDKYEVIS